MMKSVKLLSMLALAAGLAVSCTDPIELRDHQAVLKVSPASAKISAAGTAVFTFNFSFMAGDQALNLSHYVATINFEGVNGSVSPASVTTDASGSVTVTFTAPNPESFTGGTVKGTVIKVKGDESTGDLLQQGTLAVATAEVLPLSAPDPIGDEPIKKAQELKDNKYSIQKKGGEVYVFDLPQQYSSWYEGTSWMDGTKQCIHVECMDEDENNNTKGWLNGEIPLDVANKLVTINQEFYSKYPWAGAKMGTFRMGQDNMIDAHVGQGGNVKMDGSSQMWLKEKSGTKAYSGQYQFLFVLVFENEVWDAETQTYIPDGEYTICGNATVDELVADLSDFSLDYPANWVAPGQSITLTASWTAGAKFDWSKVTLNSQTRNSQSGNWFRWDASTQKLTATQSADNEKVELTFGYAGTDMTSRISLYNGPGYSSFSLSMQNSSADYIVVENDPAYGWGSDSIWLTVDKWTPEGSSFTGYGIEIDPATQNYNKLYYNPYGKYVDFKKGIPEGEFNLIFRSVTDHSVKFTIPVKVVHHKPTSFQITYRHSNGAFEPWTNGGENGVCNYPMGMEVGVITTPEDAYWNWADVELANDYDGFAFSGMGGKDDHPKLQRTKSNPGGGTSYGTQIIFRLKYDNRKTSTIYVNHN
ncbi:MAG: Ig-like domain-containing protein [Bacteroidales bacterium]|nr:Ig-like domain-containing protein [Bacteroidales bacterium]